jgi:hypothetical protein
MLFGQMCGFASKSDRVVPLPHEATCFLLQHLEGVLSIAKTTSGLIKLNPNKSKEGNVGSKIGVDARSNMLVAGLLELQACSDYLSKVLREELSITDKKPLHKVAMLSLAALSSQVEGKDGHDKTVVQTMRFAVLLGILYAAWNKTNAKTHNNNIIIKKKEDIANEGGGGGGVGGTLSDSIHSDMEVEQHVEKVKNNVFRRSSQVDKVDLSAIAATTTTTTTTK